MIEFISNWAGELIVSLIVVTIVEMLLPDNNIKKYVKTIIGVYIVFCIISPFINKEEFVRSLKSTQKSLEKLQIESQVSNNQDENNHVEALYIQEFEKDVIKRVKSLGYKVKTCDVSIEIEATKENAGIHEINLRIGGKNQNEVNSNIEIEEVEKVEISINESNRANNTSEETENEDTKKIKKALSEYYEIKEEKIKITQD